MSSDHTQTISLGCIQLCLNILNIPLNTGNILVYVPSNKKNRKIKSRLYTGTILLINNVSNPSETAKCIKPLYVNC